MIEKSAESSVVEPPSLEMCIAIPRVTMSGALAVVDHVNGPAPVSAVHVLLANGVTCGLAKVVWSSHLTWYVSTGVGLFTDSQAALPDIEVCEPSALITNDAGLPTCRDPAITSTTSAKAAGEKLAAIACSKGCIMLTRRQ